jgi:hypothetical protein
MKAIALCLNRFDTDTKLSFIDLYTKLDAGANTSNQQVNVEAVSANSDEVPF